MIFSQRAYSTTTRIKTFGILLFVIKEATQRAYSTTTRIKTFGGHVFGLALVLSESIFHYNKD